MKYAVEFASLYGYESENEETKKEFLNSKYSLLKDILKPISYEVKFPSHSYFEHDYFIFETDMRFDKAIRFLTEKTKKSVVIYNIDVLYNEEDDNYQSFDFNRITKESFKKVFDTDFIIKIYDDYIE